MSDAYDFDLIIIGSGPGGYVAAIRASQLGLRTAVVEKDKPGGVCLNIGCIPSKALIEQARIFSDKKSLEEIGVKVDTSGLNYEKVYDKSRGAADRNVKGVQYLLRKNKIEYIQGTAAFQDAHTVTVDGSRKVTAKNVMIATGSRPREIRGFEVDGETVWSSTEALLSKKLPGSMLILGAGAIGIEFAYVFNAFGVKVTVVEMMPHILPFEDREIAGLLRKAMEKQGIAFRTDTTAKSLEKKKGKAVVTLESKDGKQEVLEVEKVLSAVGRSPNSENLGLEKIGVKVSPKGFIEFGDYYQTAVSGVYAIGDVIDTPLLAHLASKEGEVAVEHMAGHPTIRQVDEDLVPFATYCEPQVASFGRNEEKLKKAGMKYSKASFPYQGIGKAKAVEKQDGILKMLFDPDSHEILSAHIIGSEGTELIHELLLAKKAELLPEDIATMIHAHPTISEGVMELARAAEGWVIHV